MRELAKSQVGNGALMWTYWENMKRDVCACQRLDQNIGTIWSVYYILTALYEVISLSASSHTVQIQVVLTFNATLNDLNNMKNNLMFWVVSRLQNNFSVMTVI